MKLLLILLLSFVAIFLLAFYLIIRAFKYWFKDEQDEKNHIIHILK